MKEKEVNNQLVKELYINRKMILATTLLFLILSLVFFFVTPKKYTATTIIYPSSSNNIDEVVANLSFGYEIHADRTLQLLKSEPMKEQLVKEFDLINYYELDTTSKTWYHRLNENYERDITFARTEHLAVMIRVTMKDPVLAANIANRAVYYLDSIQKDIFIGSLQDFRTTLSLNIENEQKQVNSTLAEIIDLSKMSKGSTPISDKKVKKLNYKIETGDAQAGDAIIMDILKNGSSIEIEKLVNEYYIKLGTLNSLMIKLEKINETIRMPFPKVHVISEAFPDSKPSSPRFVWNLVFGFLIGLVVSIGFVLTRASLRSLSASLKTS